MQVALKTRTTLASMPMRVDWSHMPVRSTLGTMLHISVNACDHPYSRIADTSDLRRCPMQVHRLQATRKTMEVTALPCHLQPV